MTEHTGTMRAVDGRDQRTGLVIVRASRLEALLSPLVELLAATRPDNVLAPQTIVAAHPGMQQWLHGELARAPGMGGIAANLDVILPSAWIDTLAMQLLGQRAVALPDYQQRHLRWTIHEVLTGDLAAIGVADARVAAYLRADARAAHEDDRARRRFQLADRLARLYSQYLVYRPDWLQAWERGRIDAATRASNDTTARATEAGLLAPLWKHVRSALGPHRGDVVAELIGRLAKQGGECADAVHVFGLSHLAPSELAVLRAFSRQRLVALYVPDPCREFWGGLGRNLDDLRGYRDDELQRIEQAGGNDYWVDQGHPLLARWGRMGQHFLLALAQADGDVLEDVRHWQDDLDIAPRTRLERLQQSIRTLKPAMLDVDLATHADDEIADASLRIHACHTRLRELEVLRDQLFDAIGAGDADGARIKPSDIVVMAPDIQAYAPLIAAVFGSAGDWREPLPYHLADVALARSHSLFGALMRVLDLPRTRITAPEVIDLLAVPEVSRRLGLDAAAVDELSEWLRESRVAWALDGEYRKRLGVPGIREHTFAWAMDRMLAGYLMADAPSADRQPAVRLADGTELAPLTGINGPAAGHLGALDQLLVEIQSLCDLSERTLPASRWAIELEIRFEALFLVDPLDREAREAVAFVRQFIRAIATEPQAVKEDPLLHFSVVRDLLVERLSSVPDRQRFLMGGIAFCGMVPQRAIPFRVVAVLGLNDGDFPRTGSDGGLDLMSRYRRLGDRDVRSDDRYLFLETVMSARARLHLSYLGEGVRDGKPRNPAPPLAELMAALDQAAGLSSDDHDSDRPWLVRHPLQPFDARYFNARDTRLFSYDARYAGMRGDGSAAAVAPFFDANHTQALVIAPPVTLRELHAYFRDPARQVLDKRMQVRLAALEDDRLPQDEPIEPRFSAYDDIARKVFFDLLEHESREDSFSLEVAPAWVRLSGRMPPGKAGRAAWDNEHAAIVSLRDALHEAGVFAHTIPAMGHREVDLVIDGEHVLGRIECVFANDDASELRLLRAFPHSAGTSDVKLKAEKDLTFRERVPIFLDWALLRLATARTEQPLPAVRVTALVKDETPWFDSLDAWDARFLAANADARVLMLGALEQRVAGLIGFWREAQSRPHWYFPKTSWKALQLAQQVGAADDDGSALDRLGDVWSSSSHGMGERDYGPGYARMLAGDIEFTHDTPERAELLRCAMQIHRWITLGANGDAA